MLPIKVAEGVVFSRIPVEMLAVFDAIMQAAHTQKTRATITGASGAFYPAGKVHSQGYAVDVRTRGIPNPERFASTIRAILRAVSPHYVVLYGDPGHLDHIHIGFAWYFASEPTGG